MHPIESQLRNINAQLLLFDPKKRDLTIQHVRALIRELLDSLPDFISTEIVPIYRSKLSKEEEELEEVLEDAFTMVEEELVIPILDPTCIEEGSIWKDQKTGLEIHIQKVAAGVQFICLGQPGEMTYENFLRDFELIDAGHSRARCVRIHSGGESGCSPGCPYEG